LPRHDPHTIGVKIKGAGMGPISAVASCYKNIVTFSGRARRAEYWWFFVFLVLVNIGIQVAVVVQILRDPTLAVAIQDPQRLHLWLKENDGLLSYSWGWALAYFVLAWLPQLSVTVRRLHDTNRSGWFFFMPTVVAIAAVVASFFVGLGTGAAGMPLFLLIMSAPLVAMIWFLVVLCLPGTQGTNRFGPDPITGRKRRDMGHPAFATEDPAERANLAERRRAEISEYYRKNVLTGVSRP
jgi:uncharacterized membrane protein YhaH (DUF805 family)